MFLKLQDKTINLNNVKKIEFKLRVETKGNFSGSTYKYDWGWKNYRNFKSELFSEIIIDEEILFSCKIGGVKCIINTGYEAAFQRFVVIHSEYSILEKSGYTTSCDSVIDELDGFCELFPQLLDRHEYIRNMFNEYIECGNNFNIEECIPVEDNIFDIDKNMFESYYDHI